MLENEIKDQMALFGEDVEAQVIAAEKLTSPEIKISNSPVAEVPTRSTNTKESQPIQQKRQRRARTEKTPAKVKAVSGLVPTGDVRLTANIREDLHLKLKIAAARRRTTIGELIEELVDKHI